MPRHQLFDSTTAKAMGQKGAAARWEAYRRKQALLKATQDAPASSVIARQLAEVRELLLHTRSLLLDTEKRTGRCPSCSRPFIMPTGERAQLLKAIDVLYDRERILCNIPLPGSRRPSKAPEAAAIPLIADVQPADESPTGS